MKGSKYYVLFVDDFSRYSWIFPMQLKHEVFDIFVKFKLHVENLFSSTIKAFQVDGGGEYTNNAFQNFLANHGIRFRSSCPNHPEQNGLVEWKHRHIVETGLTLLAHAHMPNTYWVDAFNTAVYLINRLPTCVLNYLSPYEKLFQKSPTYDSLQVFGCACFPYLRPCNTNKLQFRSKRYVFLGYSLNHQGYRCFDESSFPFQETINTVSTEKGPLESLVPTLEMIQLPQLHTPPSCSRPPPTSPTIPQTPQMPTPPDSISLTQNSLPHISRNHPIRSSPTASHPKPTIPPTSTSSIPNPLPPTPTSQTLPENSSHSMVTRRKDGICKPNPKYAMNVVYDSHLIEPTCYSQAVKHAKWRHAMGAEFNALQRNGTWSLVPPRLNMNILPNKWVFKIKKRSDGTIKRYKLVL